MRSRWTHVGFVCQGRGLVDRSVIILFNSYILYQFPSEFRHNWVPLSLIRDLSRGCQSSAPLNALTEVDYLSWSISDRGRTVWLLNQLISCWPLITRYTSTSFLLLEQNTHRLLPLRWWRSPVSLILRVISSAYANQVLSNKTNM